MDLNRVYKRCQTIKKQAKLVIAQGRCCQMLGPGAHRLVLHEQAKTGHQCELCTPGPAEQLGGSNRRTAQGGNDDIGIQYNFYE